MTKGAVINKLAKSNYNYHYDSQVTTDKTQCNVKKNMRAQPQKMIFPSVDVVAYKQR